MEKFRKLIKDYPIAATVVFLLVLAGGVVLLAWVTASSEVAVPAAEQHEVNANVAHQDSLTKEADANTTNEKFLEGETERKELKKRYERATEESKIANKKLEAIKKDYDKVRNSKVVVSGDALDPRERKLLADLRELQDGQ
jgi:hypothetical protein